MSSFGFHANSRAARWSSRKNWTWTGELTHDLAAHAHTEHRLDIDSHHVLPSTYILICSLLYTYIVLPSLFQGMFGRYDARDSPRNPEMQLVQRRPISQGERLPNLGMKMYLSGADTTLRSLYLQVLGIDDVIGFDYFEAPSQEQMGEALLMLHSLGALDEKGQVTEIGNQMSKFPLDPSLSRAILEAAKEKCLKEVSHSKGVSKKAAWMD